MVAAVQAVGEIGGHEVVGGVDVELLGGVDRPVGIPNQFAGERDEVGLAVAEDGLGLMGVGDQADGHGHDMGLGAHAGGEGHLVAGHALDDGHVRITGDAAR